MISFGAGARKCVGDTFATTQATLTLATIAARWSLRTLPGDKPARPVAALDLRPPRKFRLLVTAREVADGRAV